MQKVRILGIAPYEGMCNLMKQIAKGRNDIELTAYVGDLEQGAEIASAYTSGDIDVILFPPLRRMLISFAMFCVIRRKFTPSIHRRNQKKDWSNCPKKVIIWFSVT